MCKYKLCITTEVFKRAIRYYTFQKYSLRVAYFLTKTQALQIEMQEFRQKGWTQGFYMIHLCIIAKFGYLPSSLLFK